MFRKTGEIIRETSEIIRQIPSSRLYETSTGRLIIFKQKINKKVSSCLSHRSQGKKLIANTHWCSQK